MTDNREIILEALLLQDKGEFADKIIKSVLDKYSYLEKFERGFINRVFTGTIERKLTLDFLVNSFSSVKINKQKPVIRAILRMSVYQIMYMDSVPDSAAINEAVKLAKKKKFQGLSGFVNGVLRKIAREKDNIVYPSRDKEPVRYLSVMYSCPEWLCEHFISETDFDTAEKILSVSLEERPLTVRVNLSKDSLDNVVNSLKDENVEITVDKENAALTLSGVEGLRNLSSFENGLFCVQDKSSQMILKSDEVIECIKNASLVVDVCAAPGGKTCHVSDLIKYYNNDSCEVVARDLIDVKVDKIDENLDRCGFDFVSTEVRDALDIDDSMINKADLVIADLPCSGLGVIGRKVDIKYRVQQEDLKSLPELQRDILSVVSQYVKPGGILIYSTCTVNQLENSCNASWIKNELGLEELPSPGQIINDTIDYDGFFIARFRKAMS